MHGQLLDAMLTQQPALAERCLAWLEPSILNTGQGAGGVDAVEVASLCLEKLQAVPEEGAGGIAGGAGRLAARLPAYLARVGREG